MQPASPVQPVATSDLRRAVSDVLDEFLRDQASVLREVSEDCAPVLDAISALLSGGKRLRPAFCYWGFHGTGGELPDEGIVTAAASLELFQAAALIHDDVMDDSDTRRGQPAAHRRFEALHARSGWDGSRERFGLAGAVLAGDLCLGWSDELFSRARLTPDALDRGRRIFNVMRTQLMGGQYLDMLEQASSDQRGTDGAVDRARRVVTFKSAKYSIEHPLLLGGSLAGASTDLLADYSRFGLALGEAFQLRDDVLGVFGDPTETGKPAGDDLREGKRTVLIGLAVQAADPTQAAEVRRLLGSPELDAEGVETLRQVLVDTGALSGVEKIISEQVDVACATLDAADVTEPARAALHELVVAATSRRS
ncbi:geranylgeranyl diphosphate synthase type I [Kineococcus radiotolerans]|uniref:Geranylgeranyl diphosphate synthase type I n=1 Tax=Kineococcus radiotolerans TaxID=131568 RepID=A0A7W4XX26_KINRA|nr:polyprenyl synthetase family protein [Kineococcus radiotolerans]MBB2901533.1 geranylgeranyl diphosphate synthase type I [Kineococcus radiotolerans]